MGPLCMGPIEPTDSVKNTSRPVAEIVSRGQQKTLSFVKDCPRHGLRPLVSRSHFCGRQNAEWMDTSANVGRKFTIGCSVKCSSPLSNSRRPTPYGPGYNNADFQNVHGGNMVQGLWVVLCSQKCEASVTRCITNARI